MTDPPIPRLEALGEEFRRLGEPAGAGRRRAGLSRATGRRRAGGLSRATALVLVAVLLLGGVAAAAILVTQGAPLSPPSTVDLSSSGVPLPGSAQLAGLAGPDPDPSAPAWDVRLSRTAAGETCTAVGQILGGRFGVVGLDHVFRELPLGGVDACGVASVAGPILAGARVFLGSDTADARTVVNGVAGPAARSVTAYGPGGPRPLRLGPLGSFITVYPGYVEDVRPHVVVVTADGRSHTIAFASSSAFEVADPGGGAPWTVGGGRALQPTSYADENCAQASQELGRNDPTVFDAPLTPEICGRLGSQALVASIRRFVPGSGGRSSFPWGNSSPRTLVYGAAAPRVASIVLSGAGPPRGLQINPQGGVFLAVLDGHVDPRSLTLTVRLADGRTLHLTHSTKLLDGETGRSVVEPPAPAYRDPLPATQVAPPSFALLIPGTVRETIHASDPVGGPEWVVRSWRATPNPRANFGGPPPGRFFCSQYGVLEHGTLVTPGSGSTATATALRLTAEGATGGCDDTKSMARIGLTAQVASYVQDPYAYAPTVLRTVVSGLLPPGATRPLLLGAGPARPLPYDGNRAFLAVLPGRYWDAPLRISAVVGGRRVTRSASLQFPGPAAPAAPAARAPDPNGGAPWGFSAGANGSSSYGQIVGGRFAAIEPLTGTLRPGPEGWSGGGPRRSLAPKPPQVTFQAQGGPLAHPPGRAAPAVSVPQIQRRTLPGTTIITGVAQADVTTVTLVTPRDVRTLRPSGPQHVFIVVYDGQFFSGSLTASIHLRDGRTVSEQIPTGPRSGSSRPEPSLTTLLHATEHQLAQAEHQRLVPAGHQPLAPAGHRPLAPAGHRRLAPATGQPAAPGFSAAARAQAISELTRIVAVIRARIAYEAAHPGRLPRS